MGRCYEFGVSIDATSEHAMVVAPDGGYCVCPSTGAVCHGRFAGCADIVAQPGRGPPNAPAWARPDAATPATNHATAPTMAGVGAGTAPTPSGTAGPSPNPWPTAAPPTPPAANPVVAPPVAPPAAPAPQPVAIPTPTVAPAARTGPTAVGELGELLGVMQQLKSEFGGDRQPADRLADIERSIDRLTHHMAPAPVHGSPQVDELRAHVASLGDTMQRMATAHSDAVSAFSAQTAALHQTIENLAQMVVLSRQEAADSVERHHSELHAVRRQLIELRASIEERVEISANDRLNDELKSIRETVESIEAASPTDVVTASQLAETINTLRDAGVEEISAAHLVHTFQLEIRSLREQLEQAMPTTAQHPPSPLDESVVSS